jgi:hypothetical protein
MKVILYRDKETKKIVGYDDLVGRGKVTQEMIDNYNSNDKCDRCVELVDIEEDSVAYYFYNLKIQSKREYYEDLRNLEDTLGYIASNIDDRLSIIEDLCKEQEEE